MAMIVHQLYNFTPGGGGGGGGVGYSPNMVNGGVPLKWVTFFKKIPKHAPHFCNFTVDTRYFRPFCR